MDEIFKPRENMVCEEGYWECRDENGNLICDGGPSTIWNKGQQWEFYDSLKGYHRFDGPVTSEGQWWIRGQNVTKEIKQFAKENDIDLNNLTDGDRVIIALKFG